jgi:hypothetical protein
MEIATVKTLTSQASHSAHLSENLHSIMVMPIKRSGARKPFKSIEAYVLIFLGPNTPQEPTIQTKIPPITFLL